MELKANWNRNQRGKCGTWEKGELEGKRWRESEGIWILFDAHSKIGHAELKYKQWQY
jgi:hypothetical protein